MLEQEVKLSVEGVCACLPARADGCRLRRRAAAGWICGRPYDTSDLRLMRNGVTLRCRTGDGDHPEWTVKLPIGDGVPTVARRSCSRRSRHVPKAALDLVRAFARFRDLEPVVRLARGGAGGSCATGGDELAELVDDRVAVIEQGRVVERFRELEIEGRGIEREALERLAGVLEQSGASRALQVAKPVRALGDRATALPDVPAPEPTRARDSAAAAVRAAIANGVRRVIPNDPRTRLGEMELHQMRVGTRRLRSDLRTFRPLLDREWAESLRRSSAGWEGRWAPCVTSMC
jgi:inorganic triphosphatase YgiF